MGEWKKVRIGDVCESVSSTYRGKSKNVVLINTSDVLEGDVLTHSFSPNENLPGQFKKTFQRNDILYSEIRPQNKRFAFIDFDPVDYIASTKLMVLRCDQSKIYPEFFNYVVSDPQLIDRLQLIAETRSGTFPQITFSELSNQTFSLPPLDNQKKIVSILSSIDDKIENNRKINARLEELAHAIFKSWFIDFEPFGGKIPGDWEDCSLEDIATITSGKRPSNKAPEQNLESQYPIVGASSLMGYTSNYLYDEPILVIGRVGTHGIVQRWEDKCWPSDNTFVIKSRYYEFVFNVLKNIDYDSLNRGSTQPLITQSDIKKIQIAVPSLEILLEFENKVASLYNQVYLRSKESARLAELRDTLLPKLMSGELKLE